MGTQTQDNASTHAKNKTTVGIGLTILRIGFGILVSLHGWQKILRGPENFVGYVASMGAPMPEVAAWLVMIGEVGLGLALILGVFMRLTASLTALMFFLTWLATDAYKPLFTNAPGITGELLIVFILISIVLIFTGPGLWAVGRKTRL